MVTDPFVSFLDALFIHTHCSVSLNYFPVDSSIYMKENVTGGRQLVINTDRAQGGASLIDGQLQLMVWVFVFIKFHIATR